MANLPNNTQMFHLRRIPPNNAHPNANPEHGQTPIPTLLLLDAHIRFGRNHDLCDIVLTSSFSSSNMISRDHAEISGLKSASGRIEKYNITDHSLNGTYINDKRCLDRKPQAISEGDIIKFGHMNGASIKEMQHSPQANAEFAFVVERANPTYNYIGFRDGRRNRPIICRGDVFNCTEGDARLIESREPVNPTTGKERPVQPVQPSSHNHITTQNLPTTAAIPSSTAMAHMQANVPSNFMFPYGAANPLASFNYPYAGLNMATFTQTASALAQWNMAQQVSGFRAPNVFATGNALGGGLPTPTSTSSFRGFLPQATGAQAAMNNFNSLLTPVTAAAVLAASQAQFVADAANLHIATSIQQHFGVQPQPKIIEVKTESPDRSVIQNDKPDLDKTLPAHTLVAAPAAPAPAPTVKTPAVSPPMECDSSVPSPPKAVVAPDAPAKQKLPSPRTREEDQQSERSFVDTPPPRRAPAPAPWDSTPSPRPRDTPDRESIKEKDTKKEKQTTTATGKPRKGNEVARLLDDLTETSWVNQVKRVTTNSRRPTEEVILEQNAKKEKKKKVRKEKERLHEMARQAALSMPATAVVNIASSNGGRLEARKRLKQLSDEDSITSDSDSDVPPHKKDLPPPPKRTKKQASAESSDDGESESSGDSDDSSKKKKKKKTAKKEKAPAIHWKTREKEAAIARKNSVASQKTKKVAASKRAESVESQKSVGAQAEVDENGRKVITHDPTSVCGLNKQCTRPQSAFVNWVCCDDCELWFHNICILGTDDELKEEDEFYCGCRLKTAPQIRKKPPTFKKKKTGR